jgi:FkbM family methyltransferase
MRASKPFAFLLSDHCLLKIPVVGNISVKLSAHKKIRFHTEGYDYTTTLLYWKGVCGYESETVKIFLSLIRQVGTFVDIGANTGLYSLLGAVENPSCRVYCFEPVPRIFQALERNIRLNGLKNCRAYCQAVGDQDGDIAMFVPPGEIPTGATTNPEATTRKNEPETITTSAVKLDSFIETQGISTIDLIKIDTETTEPMVLAGAKKTIGKFRPIIICEVLQGKTEDALHSAMNNYGYSYYWIYKNELIQKKVIRGDNNNMNYLFVPEEKAREVLKGIMIRTEDK